jgi:hypothetical protein
MDVQTVGHITHADRRGCHTFAKQDSDKTCPTVLTNTYLLNDLSHYFDESHCQTDFNVKKTRHTTHENQTKEPVRNTQLSTLCQQRGPKTRTITISAEQPSEPIMATEDASCVFTNTLEDTFSVFTADFLSELQSC